MQKAKSSGLLLDHLMFFLFTLQFTADAAINPIVKSRIQSATMNLMTAIQTNPELQLRAGFKMHPTSFSLNK